LANGTQLAQDTFQRANENPLSDGGNWTTITGLSALEVSSDKCIPSATGTNCGSLFTGVVSPNDQYVEIVLAGTLGASDFVLPVLRSNASGSNRYELQISSSQLIIIVVNNGTPTTLKTVSASFVIGDVIRFTVAGASLTVYHNYSLATAVFDTTITFGTFGLILNAASTATDVAISSWTGGNAALNSNGPWVKQGIALPALIGDLPGSGAQGTSSQTMLYEGNAQLLSGTVFKMWFVAGGGSIYYAESLTGLPGSWTRTASPVLSGTSLPRIFKNGSTYYLYTSAFPTASQIDQYTSTNGTTWTLAHSAVFTRGTSGAWDAASVNYFSVMAIIGGTWYAIYSGLNSSSQFGVGIATSTDGQGAVWTRSGSNPVLLNFGPPDGVHQVGGTYYAWMAKANPGQSGTFSGVAQICRLQSTDLVNWTNSVVSIQPDNAFEGINTAGSEASTPSVVAVGSNTYIFYSTATTDAAEEYQIALAVAPYSISQIVTQAEYFAGQSQQAADNFQRANGGLGANWTTITGRTAPQIVSDAVQPFALSSVSAAFYNAVPFTSNSQYSSITNAVLSTTASVIEAVVMASSSQDSYYVFAVVGINATQTTASLQKFVSGSGTTLISTTITPQVGDVYEVSYSGGYLSAYQNGSLILQIPDSTFSSGSPGIVVFCASGSAANAQIDAFSAGNVAAFLAPNAGISGSLGALGEGATVSYSGSSSGSVTADGSGNYNTGEVLMPLGTYTITPTKPNVTFTPTRQTVTLTGSDVSGVNFTSASSGSGGGAGAFDYSYSFG
jgi:Glycosyl hydrolases family 43